MINLSSTDLMRILKYFIYFLSLIIPFFGISLLLCDQKDYTQACQDRKSIDCQDASANGPLTLFFIMSFTSVPVYLHMFRPRLIYIGMMVFFSVTFLSIRCSCILNIRIRFFEHMLVVILQIVLGATYCYKMFQTTRAKGQDFCANMFILEDCISQSETQEENACELTEQLKEMDVEAEVEQSTTNGNQIQSIKKQRKHGRQGKNIQVLVKNPHKIRHQKSPANPKYNSKKSKSPFRPVVKVSPVRLPLPKPKNTSKSKSKKTPQPMKPEARKPRHIGEHFPKAQGDLLSVEPLCKKAEISNSNKEDQRRLKKSAKLCQKKKKSSPLLETVVPVENTSDEDNTIEHSVSTQETGKIPTTETKEKLSLTTQDSSETLDPSKVEYRKTELTSESSSDDDTRKVIEQRPQDSVAHMQDVIRRIK